MKLKLYRVLNHFGVDASIYSVVFTASTTASLKLIAESFDFGNGVGVKHNDSSLVVNYPTDLRILQGPLLKSFHLNFSLFLDVQQSIFLTLNDSHTRFYLLIYSEFKLLQCLLV